MALFREINFFAFFNSRNLKVTFMSLLTALLMSNPALEEVYFPGKYFLARENSRPFLDPTTGFPVK